MFICLMAVYFFLQVDNIEQFINTIDLPPANERPPLMSVNKQGIATIPVRGALMAKGGFLMDMIGGTNTNEINQAVRAAMVDDNIMIILKVYLCLLIHLVVVQVVLMRLLK